MTNKRISDLEFAARALEMAMTLDELVERVAAEECQAIAAMTEEQAKTALEQQMAGTATPASQAGEAWNAGLVRQWRSGNVPVNWTMNAVRAIVRTLIVAPGAAPAHPTMGAVLGRETRTRELELFSLLEELGVAEHFAAFKLVIRSGARPEVGVLLIPKGTFVRPDDFPMQLKITLLARDGTALHPPVVVDPRTGGGSFVHVPGVDPEHLTGHVRVVLGEVARQDGADGRSH